MNLKETKEIQDFRSEVREFVNSSLPADIKQRVQGFLRVEREDYLRWQKILYIQGWGAPSWPVEFGGPGWDSAQRSIFEEECYAGGAPRQMPFGLSMLAPVLQKFGTVEQQKQHLPDIIQGKKLWCQGYSEPGSGSDLASLKTRAELDGDRYIINGQKIWTSYAHWANWMFCLVRTDTECKPQAGISFILIDMKTPGLTVRPIITLDGGCDVNEVFFENVEVPKENLVGQVNQGWTLAKYLLGHERTQIAGVGMCKRLLQGLYHYASVERRRGVPLLDDPRFKEKIAKIEIDLMSHQWSVKRLIALDQNKNDIGTLASVLKIRGAEMQLEIAELLMECAGTQAVPYLPEALEEGYQGIRTSTDHLNPLAAQYFDLHKVSIYGGTNEIQKNIIAKSVLGN